MTIVELFEEQVGQHADRVAVVYEDQQLSYGELNRRANGLARRLRELGVEAETRVGLYVERSPEMILGLVGILKAGGAYVPLDPSYPMERIQFIQDDSQIQLLVGQSHLKEKLLADGRGLVWMDVEQEATKDDDNPARVTDLQNLAYVIYTSGSTGRPKGVMISNGNVVNLFDSTAKVYWFGANDIWTVFHSFAFDFSVWEILGALLHGGRLVVVPYFVCRSPEMFLLLLEQQRVTVLNQTPSAFRQIQTVTPEHLALRHVVFGGEALDPSLTRLWLESAGEGDLEMINMYGITEITVHATAQRLKLAELIRGDRSPIGLARSGTRKCMYWMRVAVWFRWAWQGSCT